MIEVSGVTRRYGDFTAVKNISFSVQEGEILGMLGPNGAGKTTTIRMITGFLPPTSGHIVVAGCDLVRDPIKARRQIGYLPENVALYTEMRVREYLAYRAHLEGMARKVARAAIAEILDRCLLGEVADQVIATLSKGYRQRVGIAAAILHEPRVVVLDEPTIGLDPKQIIAIRKLIRDLGSRHTLLLSTHILPEVELLCDRVQIIDRGEIVAEGTPQSLSEEWVGNTVMRVTVKEPANGVPEALDQIDGVAAVKPEAASPGSFTVECDPKRDLREVIFRLAVERGWVLLELTQAKASLEDIFVRLTMEDSAADGDEVPADSTADAQEVAS